MIDLHSFPQVLVLVLSKRLKFAYLIENQDVVSCECDQINRSAQLKFKL